MAYKKRRTTITFSLVIATAVGSLGANSPIIGGYVCAAPDEVLKSLTHGEITRPVVGGIKMTYNGSSDYTNNDGYFSFPKLHPAPEVRLVICTETTYDLLQNTVSRIKVASQKPDLSVYKITKRKEDDDQKAWYYHVESLGTSIPADGIKSTDLIMHCSPAAVYMKDGADYYDDTEESTHFIFPQDSLFLLKTPEAPNLDEADLMNESIEAHIGSDSVESKSTETDSMGDKLPGVVRKILGGTA